MPISTSKCALQIANSIPKLTKQKPLPSLTANKLKRIIIDIEETPGDCDISFQFVDSREFFGITEFKDNTKAYKELVAILTTLEDAIRQNKQTLWKKKCK